MMTAGNVVGEQVLIVALFFAINARYQIRCNVWTKKNAGIF
jgi:hypothetical protein